MEDLKIEAGKSFNEMRRLLDENPNGFNAETSQEFDRVEAAHDAAVRALEAEKRLAAKSVEIPADEARNLALAGGDEVVLDDENGDVEVARPESTEAYRSAFMKFLRNPEVRATQLNKGTTSAGGYLVPEQWGNQVIESLVAESPLFGLAKSFVTSSGQKLHIPVVNYQSTPLQAPNLSAAAVSEGTTSGTSTYTETEDTFTEVAFSSYKFGTVTVVSDELIRDSLFPVDELIRQQAAKALAYKSGSYVAAGTGSSQPQGINQASTVLQAATGNSTKVVADDLISLQHKIGVPYRQNAQWVVSDSAYQAIRKLADGNGRYLLQWDYAAGAPATLLGKPISVDPYLPALAASAKHTVYGDINAGFGIRRVAGINIRVLFEQYALQGGIGYRIDMSMDSRLLDSAALAVYQNSAS
jgi:HK97 family phage major capsid protein